MPAKSKAKAAAQPKTTPAASGNSFRLNPPKKITFWVSIVIGAVGIIAELLHVTKLLTYTWLSPAAFVLIVIGFVLLVLGLLIKGL